ncbi:hypothetical protein TNCT_1991 [Trichonephila clavata]|uniref:Uncharacterized protein n=1 Tax=Trichonephila clavata TaxID=2740835 RepID=A0A8X6L884_TRICU|nr:hypothetical protein TNCT_1991 [Trichonephila clavata]
MMQRKVVIFSDSKSAFEAICNGDTNLTQGNILLTKFLTKYTPVDSCPPVHWGNDCADVLAKEARDLDPPSTITSEDANELTKSKISNQLSQSSIALKICRLQ